jgi:hypothetical protein
MRFAVTVAGSPRYILAFAERPRRKNGEVRLWSEVVTSSARVPRLVWRAVPPREVKRAGDYRVVAIASAEPIDPIPFRAAGADLDALVAKARAAGALVTVATHRLTP